MERTAAFLLPIIDCIISTRAPSGQSLSVQAPQAVINDHHSHQGAGQWPVAIQISDEAGKFATGTDVKTAILYGWDFDQTISYSMAQALKPCIKQLS